jgi:hypothetical protein
VVRTAEGAAPDRIDVSVTQGIIYQKNRNIYPIRTTSGDTIIVHVVNNEVKPYSEVFHIGEISATTDGTTWSQNNRVNFVVWGVSSQNAVDCKLMVNTCSGVYGSDAAGISDALNFTDYTIPKQYLGTGFLICRVTMNYTVGSSGTWEILQVEDLRGRVPNTSAGGGSQGGSSQIAVKNSIEQDVDLIYQLVGDELTPTADYFYGVDSGSTKGWHPIPSDDSKLNVSDFDTYSGNTHDLITGNTASILTKADKNATIILLTGSTILNESYNNKIIEVSGSTGLTGVTITTPTGLTVGWQVVVVNMITVTITIASDGTILSKGSAVNLANQYGAASMYHRGNNVYTLFGDIS